MKQQSSGRDFFVLLALCLIGVVFGRLQSTATADGKTDFVSRGIRSTVEPLSRMFTSMANGTSDFFTGIFSAAELTRRNRELMQLQTVVNQYSDTMDRLVRDIDNLRKLNDLPPAAGRIKIAATVIGYAPNENRITISVGANKDVTVGLAVVTAQGLVGTIQTVDKGSAQVSLLSDPNRKIGAMVSSRNPPPLGVIRGENANTLVLPLDASAPVQNGDLVSTSGFSDRIPRGIPIGRVNQIYDDANSGSRRVEVFPNVALGSVREVVVLK